MNERISAAEFRKATGKRSKYGNRKVVVDGITFDSKREADYYAELKIRERAGEVDDIRLQEPFVLAFQGCLICTYRADFTFYDRRERRQRVVDTKGFITPEFRLKAKMMRALLGIEVEIVK